MSHSFAQARRAVLASLVAVGLAAPVSLGLSVASPDFAEATSSKKLDSVKGLAKGKSFGSGKLSSKLKKGKGKGKGSKSLLSGKGGGSILSAKGKSSLKNKLSKYIDLGDSGSDYGGSDIGGSEGFSSGSLKSKASKWKSRARDFARSLDF
ncbi:MAG: hypothetical protein AAFV69_02160 [Pseudomonadota bacterium]